MPLFFWKDADGQRYRASYFEMVPGIWRHGDWIRINQRGGCVIYGRSDSTINRYGVRMGTSEIYQAVAKIPEIVDSLVVDLEALGITGAVTGVRDLVTGEMIETQADDGTLMLPVSVEADRSEAVVVSYE